MPPYETPQTRRGAMPPYETPRKISGRRRRGEAAPLVFKLAPAVALTPQAERRSGPLAPRSGERVGERGRAVGWKWAWGLGCAAAVAAGAIFSFGGVTADAGEARLRGQQVYSDGYARPRALAVDARGDRVYVALSTADRLGVIDVAGPAPRRLPDLEICAFPDALAARPQGGVVVSCRFDPALRVVSRGEAGKFDVRMVDAGPEHGDRAVALDGAGRFAYVGSAARGGVKIVDLAGPPARPRFVATGIFPEVLRFVPADAAAGRARALLIVANTVSHTVVVHPVEADGGLAPAAQTIQTAGPVRDVVVVGPPSELSGLLLATYEDRVL